MQKYDVIFCVLAYKNDKDVKDFIDNMNSKKALDFSYKIIVVNNFADEESLIKIRDIAEGNQCIFLANENKGYGHGNNRGIDFANKNFEYKYLVVCNPDTVIEELSIKSLDAHQNDVIAPNIRKLSGELQNPMNYVYMPLCEKMLYIGFKNQNKLFVYAGIIGIKLTNKLHKMIEKIKGRESFQIHACHGSFLILPKSVIEKISPVYDEKIFLFGEEGDLARKCRALNIPSVYVGEIKIIHKEDGSMQHSKVNLQSAVKDSYLYYYEKWSGK